MKAFFLFSFCFLLIGFGQTKSPEVYLKCYKNGDTLSAEALPDIRNISLLTDGKPQKESWIKTWEMLIYRDGKPKSFPGFTGSPTIVWPMNEIRDKNGKLAEKIVFQGVIANTKVGDKTIEKKIPSATFYLAAKPGKACN